MLMKLGRMIAIGVVFWVVTFAWLLLGVRMSARSAIAKDEMGNEVREVWGPGLVQGHVEVSGMVQGSDVVRLESTQVEVDLKYRPQKRGLLWHRTYDVAFGLKGVVANGSESAQNVRLKLVLPEGNTSYDQFKFRVGEETETRVAAKNGVVETSVMIPAKSELPLEIGYVARGMDSWSYAFGTDVRLRDFGLKMRTDFEEISFPVGSSSPTLRTPAAEGEGWLLEWRYEDVLAARGIAMEMPGVVNAGPVVARITYFAPLSLLLFFGVVMVVGMLRGVDLHPVQYGLVAAGFFAFHALLGYLVDVMPLGWSFVIATLVSLALASGYLYLVKGKALAGPASAAQLVYLVLFSYSFFFEGFTGLTLTVIGVATLAGLMWATARVDWDGVVGSGRSMWIGGRKEEA
ncbi:hypothetical protein FEM03_17570 [Phragmitibacter flavus]|uniref:Cell envelope integrity protein CreD n=1 Tax=Phragmitibacter flavus TaxID=2576071 RepID=A0A5R8KAW3_9BACT|nr:inner membrane CreD family protein [Phragmitibacter flavus]TLD69452.1 hypothetical protein FEM03_17570 [Phragmitibacter flavus]